MTLLHRAAESKAAPAPTIDTPKPAGRARVADVRARAVARIDELQTERAGLDAQRGRLAFDAEAGFPAARAALETLETRLTEITQDVERQRLIIAEADRREGKTRETRHAAVVAQLRQRLVPKEQAWDAAKLAVLEAWRMLDGLMLAAVVAGFERNNLSAAVYAVTGDPADARQDGRRFEQLIGMDPEWEGHHHLSGLAQRANAAQAALGEPDWRGLVDEARALRGPA